MQNTNLPQAEKIDDKQFHQIAAQLLHSIELSLEHADEALDLDLDIARQGGNVINIAFHDRSVIVVNTQPPLHEIWVAAKAGGFHYRWAGTALEPLWLDTKTGNELLADLSSFVSAQAGKDVKVSLLGTR
jgi:CyaY protein